MQALLWPIVSWLLREVVLRFVILGAIFLALSVLVPMAVGFLTPWLGTSGLSSAFQRARSLLPCLVFSRFLQPGLRCAADDFGIRDSFSDSSSSFDWVIL